MSLVRAGASGDRKKLTTTVEALIAEERAKQHNILADRLTRALRSNGTGPKALEMDRARDFLFEAPPQRRLEDLVLPEPCEQACRELIEEQRRASLLRSYSLEPRHRVLLVGSPGNGKTSLAEAIAEAACVSVLRRPLRDHHRQLSRRDRKPAAARFRLRPNHTVRFVLRRIRRGGKGTR